jgi:Helix-hairpin-helix motif
MPIDKRSSMTDFLTFLNTADLNILTKIPGVTRTIAGNIVAARPFDFVEDVAKVDRVGKNLLAKMQSFFEAELNDSRNSAMIPMEHEAMTTQIPARQPEEEKPSFGTRFGLAFGNFMRALLRLIVIIVVIGGIGAGLYYGLPLLTKKFLTPVERNTARVNELESQVTAMQSQLDEMNTRVDAIETSAAAHTASLQKLEEMQTSIESDLGQNNDKVLMELKHEVMMTRVLDMLGRARLYLAQSNFGLAKEDVQNARDLLAELQSETKAELLTEVISRLDLALGNLPAFPVVASGDLEIAWQILISGKAAVLPATPTPAAVDTATPPPPPSPTLEVITTP